MSACAFNEGFCIYALCINVPDPLAQSVATLIAESGVMSLILAWSHTFMEIDNEIYTTFIPLYPLIQEGLVSVARESMWTKYFLTA